MKTHKKKLESIEPIGKVKVVKDFLPPPEQLVLKQESTKITLALSKDSVDFFKKVAGKQQIGYQKVIRALLDQYVAHYKQNNSKNV